MELYTRILLPKARFSFSYEDRVVMMGSCFAENIGRKLEENKFSVDINPFGTLYNPASVAEGLRMLLRPERFTSGDLFRHEGVYHSFTHHSRFSAPSEEECLDHINSRLSQSSDFLRKATRLVITLGTAFVYRLKSDGRIVSNCHKLPEKMFDRQRLSTQEIVEDWKPLLLALWEQNPALKILFTVSPIRHWKDGAHENQLSKATLLLATDALQKDYPGRIAYFPAYEILHDELRDYRFYASDLTHPSDEAVAYIADHFVAYWASQEEREVEMRQTAQRLRKLALHRPKTPHGAERLQAQIAERIAHCRERYGEKLCVASVVEP